MADHDLIDNVQVDSGSFTIQSGGNGMFVVQSWSWDEDAGVYTRITEVLSRDDAIDAVFGYTDENESGDEEVTES